MQHHLARISIFGSRIGRSISQTSKSCSSERSSERSFFSGSLFLPLPTAKFHPSEKPKTGKLRLFSEFHKHVFDLHVLVA